MLGTGGGVNDDDVQHLEMLAPDLIEADPKVMLHNVPISPGLCVAMYPLHNLQVSSMDTQVTSLVM